MFDSISKNAIVITGALIFLGFFKYQAYYRNFGIDIFNYITNFELSLSFISIIIGYFVPYLIVQYLLNIFNEVQLFLGGKKARRKERRENVRTPVRLAGHILYNKKIDSFFKLELLWEIIKHPNTIVFPPFFILSFTFLTKIGNAIKWKANLFLGISNEDFFYILSMIWLMFILEPLIAALIINAAKSRMSDKFPRIIRLVNYFLITIFFLFFSQKINAIERLNGEVVDNVHVHLKTGESINTSKTMIFIGETREYLFLVNKLDNTNIILSRSEIKSFSKQAKYDSSDLFLVPPVAPMIIDTLNAYTKKTFSFL